ncbi:MAG: hypothetical protein WBP16_14565 [Ferruginibacter sp.]
MAQIRQRSFTALHICARNQSAPVGGTLAPVGGPNTAPVGTLAPNLRQLGEYASWGLTYGGKG